MYMKNEDRIESKDGNLCVIDNRGLIVIKPEIDIDALYYPNHGLCQVERDGKFGYIDEQGKLVIPFKYENAFPFSENGLAFVVCENGLGGYINKKDEFVIDPIYETGSAFRFGFAAVSKDGSYEYIYKNGMKAINHTFKYAGGFSECGLAKVVEFTGIHSLMDVTSLVVLELKKGCELAEFKDGIRLTKFTKNGREAMINAAGDIITGFYDHIIISPYARRHPFLKNGLWGYLDNTGKEVIPNIYKEVTPFTENKVARVKAFHPLAKNNEWEFYINVEDEIMDSKLIEGEQRNLSAGFSIVYPLKKCLALAKEEVTDDMEKITDDQMEAEEQKKITEELKIFYDLYSGGLGAQVKTAIDYFDPYLICPYDDGPYDEYDRESMIIASRIKADMSEDEIAEVIADVFSRWFNSTYHAEDCLYPAEAIYEYLCRRSKS